jgi:hypothetical protein
MASELNASRTMKSYELSGACASDSRASPITMRLAGGQSRRYEKYFGLNAMRSISGSIS